MAGVPFEADVEHQLDELVQRGVRAIQEATHRMAVALRDEHLPAEAPQGGSGLLAQWTIQGHDPLTWVASPLAWYAHFVARGRGPADALTGKMQALPVEGQFRAHVGPAAANPFHERAQASLEARTDEFIEQALHEEGLA